MSRKKRKRGRGRVLILVVLLALIVFGVFARGIFTSGKPTTEHAQRELHTYAAPHETSIIRMRSCSCTPATRTRAISCATTRRRRISPR